MSEQTKRLLARLLLLVIVLVVAVFLTEVLANAKSTSEKYQVRGYPSNDTEMHDALICGLPRQGEYESGDYHEGNLPDFVALNQMKDNPVFGDETESPYWLSTKSGRIVTQLQTDTEYTVHYYLHTEGKNATGVRMRAWPMNFYYTNTSYAGKSLMGPRLGVEIDPESGSEYEFFPTGWYATETIRIDYVPYSVQLARVDGSKSWTISEVDFFSDEGALIGDEELDGVLHTGYENAIEITFKIETKQYRGQSLQFLDDESAPVTGSALSAIPSSTTIASGPRIEAASAGAINDSGAQKTSEKPISMVSFIVLVVVSAVLLAAVFRKSTLL